MKSLQKYMIVAVAVLLAVAGYSLFETLTPFDTQRPAMGEPAPEIALESLKGGIVRLSDYRGKVVLVNFWGSWCTPCREEIPGFRKVFSEYRDKGFTVLAVAVDDVPESIEKLDLPFPVVLADRQASKDYGNVVHLPSSFLVGKDGKIIRKMKGIYPEGDLRSHLKEALNFKDAARVKDR